MTTQDQEHLRLLSILHYVFAGLTALFSLFPIVHLIIGIAMVGGWFPDDEPGKALFGWMFILFPLIFIVTGLAFAACLAMTAQFLAQRRNYTFCFVIAAVSCVAWPIGTGLGVFTIIVLMRDSVKQAFGVASELAPSPSASDPTGDPPA